MIPINYIFSIGYRCNSVQFLRKYEMSKFSGPFDWMYIDLDTSLINISDRFSNYLTDIDIQKDPSLTYMSQNYSETVLPINTRFTERNSDDIYDWERICVFLHHDLNKQEEIEKINARIDRFNELMDSSPEKIMLVYISKILNSPEREMESIIEKVEEYGIKSYAVFVLCSPETEEYNKMIGNCLFIFKKVPNYSEQYEQGRAENEFEWTEWGMQGINFDKEYEVVKSYFDMNNLISKDEI